MGSDFSPGRYWSYSGAKDFEECKRRHFYLVYASWGGWNPSNGPVPRLLYQYKKSQAIEQYAGTLVHDSVRKTLEAVRRGSVLPETKKMVDRIEQLFVEGARYSSDKLWQKARHPGRAALILHNHLISRDLPSDRVTDMTERVRDCMDTFLDKYLPEMIKKGPQHWTIIDSLNAVRLNGYDVFSAPDFVVEQPEPKPREIIDWKSGRNTDPAQLQVYTLTTEMQAEKQGNPNRIGHTIGRSISLLTGKEQRIEPSLDDLDHTRCKIIEDIKAMWELNEAGVRRDPTPFPKTEYKGMCNYCKLQVYCEAQA